MVAPNSVTIAGNAADNAEVRFTKGGTAVANFTVASTPRVFNSTTEKWEDGETLWMRVTMFGQSAENIGESVLKGTRVLVTGHLEQKNWEKDGEKRTSVELLADDVAVSLLFATVEVFKNEKKESTVTARKRTSSRK